MARRVDGVEVDAAIQHGRRNISISTQARGLERRRTRQLARRCLRGWRARGRQALVLATPQQKHNRERSSRSLFREDAIRRIHAPYT